jgi:type II secretory pathway pseudopilin PulG
MMERIKEQGITFVELMIVMSVVGILVVALGFTYQQWQGAYRVESQVKTLYSDLMDARTRATGLNATFLADFPTNRTYRVARDNNPADGAIQAAEVLPAFRPDGSKRLDYDIAGGVLITFDSKGLIYQGGPPVLIPAGTPVTISFTSTASPDYDCIHIYPTKIVMGQVTGGNCVDR